MEQLIPYIPVGSMFIFLIVGFVGVKVSLKDKPSFSQTERRYVKKELCEEIHKSVNEKLDCIPTIKDTVARLETKFDIIIKNNGNK